ncbi:hydroxyacylglutathione hydrolase [Sphingomicrobium sp. XHP0239]|uniref:hydroxyacylglutathione hydrolase n=1 Tax=Sphingomicrobium maritimum TaxID=3133972 RepID=UPI0031CC4FC3
MVEMRDGYEIDRAGRFEIACVPAFTDNYHWLAKIGDTVAVVDPGDGQACLKAADALGWPITYVLNTHWHPDHVGGNQAVKDATDARILGPAPEADKIPGIDVELDEGDTATLGSATAAVWHVPGHTLGHIAYHFPDDGIVFCGDTLFAMGCGKLFEGTPEQMHRSLQRFGDLPDDTLLYCAHEYTEANGRFALTADPDNDAIRERQARVETMRAEDRRTVPTTVKDEKATNVFLRAPDPFTLGKLRAAKDRF